MSVRALRVFLDHGVVRACRPLLPLSNSRAGALPTSSLPVRSPAFLSHRYATDIDIIKAHQYSCPWTLPFLLLHHIGSSKIHHHRTFLASECRSLPSQGPSRHLVPIDLQATLNLIHSVLRLLLLLRLLRNHKVALRSDVGPDL